MSEPAAIPAKATRVRLFEDRAEVTRVAEVNLQEGSPWVRLAGASLFTDDRSLQAVAAVGKVLAARVVRQTRVEQNRPETQLKPLRAEYADVNKRISVLQRKLHLAETQGEFARTAQQQWSEGFSQLPPLQGAEAIEHWRAALEQAVAEDDRVAESIDALNGQLEVLRRQQGKLHHEIQTGATARHVRECFLEVQLETRGGDDRITVSYRTPAAMWRPEHTARLLPDAKPPRAGEVEWTSYAVVWQRTGEDWTDIELVCSTARPAAVAEAPDLEDDVLSRRKKTPEEKKQVVVEVREQAVNTVARREEPQMPGVDDGGKPVEFTPKGRYHVASDGKPLRIEISRVSMPATLSRSLLPERAPVAHLRATMSWAGGTPLLAGPLALARGGALVGRARTSFAATGEEFSAGFGPEDGVRCRRNLHEYHETAKLTGAQKVVREVTLYLSNLSDQPRELDVTERLPVSEIEGLEIHPTDIKAWKLNEKDGYLTQTIKLDPAANLTLKYSYEIRAKSNVVLPF